MAGNERKVISYNIIRRVIFDLIIEGFIEVDNFIINITTPFQIAFILTFLKEISINLVIPSVSLVFSAVSFIENIMLQNNISSPNILFEFTESIIFDVIFSNSVQTEFFLRELIDGVTNIDVPTISTLFEPLLGQFNPLLDYDPDTLGSMDVITLGALDFTAT